MSGAASALFAIMLLAGLQGIPTELYEAAPVDGASVTTNTTPRGGGGGGGFFFFAMRWSQLPLLTPVLLTPEP